MVQLSISESARVAGKARATINRYIKNGKLSVTRDNQGNPTIDTTELIRVFGEIKTKETDSKQTIGQYETLAIEILKEELKKATEREGWLKQQLEIEQQRYKDLEQKMLPSKEKKGFFRKLFS